MKLKNRALFAAIAIGLCTVAQAEPAPPSELTSQGLRVGMPYAQAKQVLLARGWRIDTSEQSSAPAFKQHPEITCGEGINAICSAGYQKGGEYLALTVQNTKQGLVVNGTY